MLVLIVCVTLAFEFTNGWHDSASSIATVVSTRVLRPLWAVVWAAFWNFVAAFVFGTAVAKTMGSGLVDLKMVNQNVLLAGLLGAIVWNYATIRIGLPASSSHALMGGYGGAAIAAAGFGAIIVHGWVLPVIFIFVGPFIGLAAALVVTVITSWVVRKQAPRRVDKWFRRLQLVSAAAFSLGHGTNDAQKGMGIITAALVSSGTLTTYRGALLGDPLLPLGHRRRYNGRRLAGSEDHGAKNHQAQPLWRLRGGNFCRHHADRNRSRRHPSKYHPRDHRGHRRCRGRASPHRGAVGRYQANFLGLGADDSRRWSDGRGVLLSFDSLDQVIWRVTKLLT
jgi:phosphate/sulfate permease